MMPQLLLGSVPANLAPLLTACLADAPADVRIRTVKSILRSAAGRSSRQDIGNWIARILSVETLVPDVYGPWRLLVRDSIQFVFSRLSDARLAAKLVEQVDLPLDTEPANRLVRLVSQMPGIQKVGQVLARDRNLGAPLRAALSELENGMSDANPERICAMISKQLGRRRLRTYDVRVDPVVFSEASVSAAVRFTWRNPESGERERGVFKVLKPHIRRFFAQDLALLQQLSEFVAHNQGYGFATHHVAEMVAEVRLLLEHELDFVREQATLIEAFQAYTLSFDVRVPRLIAPLCTDGITAMSDEKGVKITEAFRRQPDRRPAVAEQLIEALVVVPLLSREEDALFHADPHAGNLLYHERTREVVILDWALTGHLSRASRRYLSMLVIMTTLRNAASVASAIRSLAADREKLRPDQARLITESVNRFFQDLPMNRLAGALDAMELLDRIAIDGVRFPASLAMFQKAMFTLDGVLHDIAGSKADINGTIVRNFLLRLATSLGLSHPPLTIGDLLSVDWAGLTFPVRLAAAAVLPQGLKSRLGLV